MTAPTPQQLADRMSAHCARRAGADERKPKPIRVRGVVIDWSRTPWPWPELGPEIVAELKRVATAAVVGLALIGAARAGDLPSRPDPALTPGAVATTDEAAVCQRSAAGHFTYARAHRVWHDKYATCAKYGLDADQCEATEDDDLVPICAGGDNADPRNHWPQALPQAYRKDRIEWAICRAVCDGRMSLKAAQSYFLGADWLGVVGGE